MASRQRREVSVPTRLCIRPRRIVGLLVSLALLVGVPAAGSVAGRAADPTPDYLASFDACPEDAIPKAGFVDVPLGDPSAADIDCIAYYGITRGTSSTTYSPEEPVTREQMALFLVRLAALVGINLHAGVDTPFEDVAHLTEESREAIGRIYRLGITAGATDTTYQPARNVTRGEMALFLQRLMDLMAPAADGRIPFGFTPDDVNDNDGNFDVESPFQDLEGVAHPVFDAVTQLYELGVATGISEFAYAPGDDITRATMAEFMAAVLDHSNLRPRGVMVQVTPTDGADDFEIFMMVSVRDADFAPIDDAVVDWFYTDDPEGGLLSDGTCDRKTILAGGDCVWDGDEDEAVDLDGNFFEDFDATPGATMSIYAWVGKRDGQRFDRDTAVFSFARAVSEKDAESISVRHDAPATASRISGNGALIVDLDRRSSVAFSIQLLDEDGAALEKEGVPIEIEVESRAVRVDAEDVRGGRPEPDLFSIGRDVSTDTMVLTDERGSAVFDLRGPARNERLDTVTMEADCCVKQTRRIVWSDGESVLVATPPAFDSYRRREDDRIELTVKFDLVDQYGAALRGTDPRYTGRPNTEVEATFSYRLYHAPAPGDDRTYTVTEIPDVGGTPGIKINRRGVSADIEIEIPAGLREGHDFLVSIDTRIWSDRDEDGRLDSNEVRYLDGDLVVWIVNNARDEEEFDVIRERGFVAPPGLGLEEVELYAAGRKYRTFFTLWSYEPSHMFQANGEFVDVETFENLWRRQVDSIDDLDVLIYGAGFSLTVIK
ncbi:MAG: S-layer homology domain-containing protein [Acidimicrobiia bacterium]|nr:S-layer homology domain-containing protein [Acidimicrobiia bacterium]